MIWSPDRRRNCRQDRAGRPFSAADVARLFAEMLEDVPGKSAMVGAFQEKAEHDGDRHPGP